MDRICPECGNTFACREDVIPDCTCAFVPLTGQDLQYIASRYSGCLCADCLWKIHNRKLKASQYV